MSVTVSIDELVAGVRCETGSRMAIAARFIGHVRVEVCGPDGLAPAGALAYRLEGPGGSFAGTTDSAGRLAHEDVVAGDYVLTFPGRADLRRIVSTSARRAGWRRTTVLVPREAMPPRPARPADEP